MNKYISAAINEYYDMDKELLYDGNPKIGDFFGVITNISSCIPNSIDSVNFEFESYDVSDDGPIPLLFKRIDEETAIEISTGIPFLFKTKKYFDDISDMSERLNVIIENFHKYRRICLEIDVIDYIVPNDDFKLLYANVIENGSEELKKYLDNMVQDAHDIFEERTAEILDEAHSIAIVDNAIYDAEKKYKVKALTKQNDEEN